MDAIPAILVFGPFFQQPPSGHLGLAQLAGLDPYHSAILLLMAVGIATMTPPVGTAWSGPARLLAIGRQGAVRPAIPILVALLATFAVLAWQPGLTLWLPDRVLGPGA